MSPGLRILPVVLAALSGTVLTASIQQEPRASSNLLAFPIVHNRQLTPISRLKKRADTDVQVYNVSSVSYLIQLDIGNPSQPVMVAIDTGSSELWVNPDCRTAQTRQQAQQCQNYGKYDPTDSSSSVISSQTNSIKYGIGEVSLQYVSDDIKLPGSDIALTDVVFGYGTSSKDLNQGILGLSFGSPQNLPYKSLVDEVKDQGVSKVKAFGVALGSKDDEAHSGLLTFGGVDTKKFVGKLHTSPILEPKADEGGLFRYWVNLDSVGITFQGQQAKTYSNSRTTVFFDTGATLCYLPSVIINQLVSDLGAQFDDLVGLYTLPCGQKGSVDFTFDSFTVNVDMDEFIWELDGLPNVCALGAEATDDGSFILGDSFLRAVYAIFDLDSYSIHFAQYADCGSNLQEIPVGQNAAAQFVGECNQQDVDNARSSGKNGGSGGDDDNAAGRVGGAWLTAGALVAAQVLATLL